jgi:lysophospholipase L1-like esterase
MKRRIRKAALFIAINLLVILIVMEVATRVTIADQLPPRIAEPHPEIGFVQRPNAHSWRHTSEFDSEVVINPKGLHDRDYPYAKPDGVFRILMIGDSFVAALEVDPTQNFSSLLEGHLTQANGPSVEVINGGVLGYGTSNALLWLEAEGLRYEPDLVVYGFYANDVTDNLNSELFHMEDGALVQTPPGLSLWRRLRPVLYDVSYLYRAGVVLTDRQARTNDDTLIQTPWRPILPIYRADLAPREHEAWQLTAALLERMAQADVPLMIVYFPEIFQSVDEYWQAIESGDEVVLRDAPNNMLRTIIPDGVTFFDASLDFRASDEALYFVNDGHFNVAGHQRMAGLLEAEIRPFVTP